MNTIQKVLLMLFVVFALVLVAAAVGRAIETSFCQVSAALASEEAARACGLVQASP